MLSRASAAVNARSASLKPLTTIEARLFHRRVVVVSGGAGNIGGRYAFRPFAANSLARTLM
jgi:hypothetical protein